VDRGGSKEERGLEVVSKGAKSKYSRRESHRELLLHHNDSEFGGCFEAEVLKCPLVLSDLSPHELGGYKLQSIQGRVNLGQGGKRVL
jgi:hypothetical protein